MKRQNIIGAQVRRLRYKHGWSQAQLAIKLQLKGLDISREVVAQIEGQMHCVRDTHLPYFAQALGVSLIELFPNLDPHKPIHDSMKRPSGADEPEVPPKVVMKSLQPSLAKAGKPELTI